MPLTRFMIAGVPRTGTNWLCHLLSSHPDVLCHAEVFHHHAIYYAFRSGHTSGPFSHLATMESRDADPRGFVERLWQESLGRGAVGFKILSAHQHLPIFWELAEDAAIRKVVARRRNVVRTFVSAARAKVVGRYTDVCTDGVRVTVDPDELLRYAASVEEYYARLKAALRHRQFIEVWYEDLCADPRAEVARILDFLGVASDGFEPRSPLHRQSHDDPIDAIANFDEVSEALRGTPLRAQLHVREPVALT